MVQNRLIQKMFENRGIDPVSFSKYDDPTHGSLARVDELCERLRRYQNTGETVAVLTDFDMDGIMSSVIAQAALREFGISSYVYVVNPEQGYGFDASTIHDLLTMLPDTKAILTGDVGVACFEGIDYCREHDVEILVTDHHKPRAVLPKADCIVNPMLKSDPYEHPQICGAYVMYQCMRHYADRYCDLVKQEQIDRLRVFAGIGTVSDYMPVLYENRQLLRDSISICRMVYSSGSRFFVDLIAGTRCSYTYKRVFNGLFVVLQKLADMGKISSPDDINESLFGYYIAPMFNSLKRIGTWDDMRRMYGIFFGDDDTAESAVNMLYDLNEKRKAMVADYTRDMNERDQPFAPYVYLTNAPAGICGLLAQPLCVNNGMPVCVVRDDGTLHGSGRSPSWYPFLDQIGDRFYAAGHNSAFGIGFKDRDEIQRFCDFLKFDVSAVADLMADEIVESKPDFVIACDDTGDTMVDILLFIEYLDELRQYQPFGQGFPPPDIELRFAPSDGSWSVMGSRDQHLKIILPQGLEVLLWNKASEISRQDGLSTLVMRGRLEENVYRGNHKIVFVGDFV